jgi:hypothetical protein
VDMDAIKLLVNEKFMFVLRSSFMTAGVVNCDKVAREWDFMFAE